MRLGDFNLGVSDERHADAEEDEDADDVRDDDAVGLVQASGRKFRKKDVRAEATLDDRCV